MTAAIVVFPGSNCDRDAAVAIAKLSGERPAMVWHRETALPPCDLVVIPGGFSYGDYLRCGAMAALSPIMRAVRARADDGVPVLGICNGFQILVEAGLLPGALLRNASLRYICKDVYVRVETTATAASMAAGRGAVLRMPIAHNEGNYFADAATLQMLEDDNRVVFRYCDRDGSISARANPNGSLANIAGICNAARNVVGLMPHPERLFEPELGGEDGAVVLRSALGLVA
ncbi:MAG: phosphoribosylformylglycinamidine synthase subunit PurQ [Alphaproteobacteria bacterium]